MSECPPTTIGWCGFRTGCGVRNTPLVALPRDHPRTGGAEPRMADLAGEGWIEGNPSGTSALVRAGLRAGFTPRIDFPVRE